MEILPPAQIKVTETVLGKGAFGEVRVARWRNVDVAYKRLFVKEDDDRKMKLPVEEKENNEENLITVEDIAKEDLTPEIEMLSKLRHPNLLLFIGITKEATSPHPSIITELMSYSLYDLLETHKIELSLPDILDISLDVCNGLEYLHKYEPPIIHRDISSKNILINGNRAKIADLGQAKLFNVAAASKQTGIPGAMAYSAPEVLTGKYTTKIDIYSFGILLCQMCHNEYPRIDRRQEQIDNAKKKYSILSPLLTQTLHFHPTERPEAEMIGQQLLSIIENDRYYPISRRILPEKDIGILGYHSMTKQMNSKYNELLINLEKTQKLLTIEEKRWKEEAGKVDLIENEKNRFYEDWQQEKRNYERVMQEKSDLFSQFTNLQQENIHLIDQLKFCSTEISSLQEKMKELNGNKVSSELTIKQQIQEIQSFKEKEKNHSIEMKVSNEKYEKLNEKLTLTQKQLAMQVDYSKDLENRLEQILTRWKEEKEISNQEKTKNISLNAAYSQLIHQRDELQLEYSRCDRKLRQYEGLPLPDEIKLRFDDFQKENDLLREKIHQLINEKEEIEENKQLLLNDNINQQQQINDLLSQITHHENHLKTNELEIQQLSSTIRAQETMISNIQQDYDLLMNEKENILLQNKEYLDKITMISNELVQEKRMKAQLSIQLQKLQSSVGVSLVAGSGSELLSNPVSLAAGAGGEGSQELVEAVSSPNQQNNSSNVQTEIQETQVNGKLSEVAIKHIIERTIGREGVKGLIELIMTNTHDDRILWRSLRSIRELILSSDGSNNQSSKDLIQETNPEIWLIELFLKAYPLNRMIQSQVMRFIGTFTFGNDYFRRKMGEKQIMNFITLNFKNFPTDEMVLLHNTMALTNLTHGSKENRSRFAETGGIPILIKLMHQHLANPKLQCQFCWALLTLSGSDEIALEISEQKGDLVAIQSVLSHPEDASIQEYGLWTLYNMALASPEIASLLKGKGIIEICLIASENHTDHDKVMQQVRNLRAFYQVPAPGEGAAAASRTSGSTREKKKPMR